MKKIIILITIFCFTYTAFAQDSLAVPHYSKIAGDSAYQQNLFSEAITNYEVTLKTKGESSTVLYNLGNAYYKDNNIARAIINYERALLLDPGNEDIRFNLEMARTKLIDKVEPKTDVFLTTWLNNVINTFSTDQWAVAAICSFLLLLTALYFYIFSKQLTLKKGTFFASVFLLIAVICTASFSSIQKKRIEKREYAIVTEPSITVKSTPTESGTAIFVLHEGHKVKIQDGSMKEWREIQIEDGKVGWIPASAIENI